MCGIFGILNVQSGAPFDLEKFRTSLGTIAHRGPDGEGVQVIGTEAVLGHRRLSIIDLSDDNAQPMHAFERYWLVFNGEIFNYVELRDELMALGRTFRTTGDTEVLLNAYAEWGEDCVPRLNGMWAFAIYDTLTKTLFCSRDRFGEKPFCYSLFEGRFYFASEVKPILAYEPRLIRPNYNIISNFCRSSVGAQHAETWFENVARLPPGCNATINAGKITIRRYWSYPDGVDENVSFDEAKRKYDELFRDAVRIRMRSDVPLGLTLSAGLDSNSIAYVMRAEDKAPHYCFTSSFHEGEQPRRDSAIFVDANEVTDEARTARRVANELGFESVVVSTDYSNFVHDLSRVIYYLESGNSAPAVIPLMQLMREARTRLKVVLEGQGADELLCGYVGTLIWRHAADLARAGKLRRAFASLKSFNRTYKLWFALLLSIRAASNSFPSLLRMHQRWKGIDRAFGPRLRRFEHMPDFPPIGAEGNSNGVARTLREQHSGGLVNLLHYGDAVSMANSVESRMPFLDHRLVDFVWTLPTHFKMKLGIGKYIHREAMRGFVPDWIIDNPIKYGFCTPVNEQFRKPDGAADDPVAILLSERCLSRGIFDGAGLADLIADHRAGKHDHGPLLFRLLSTELWFRNFVDTPVRSNPPKKRQPSKNLVAAD